MSQKESSNGRHRRRIRGSKEGGNKRGGLRELEREKGSEGARQTDRHTETERD